MTEKTIKERIKNIFAAIKLNWKLFLFFLSKKKQKKFDEEMKKIIENVKRESKNKLKNKRKNENRN